MRRRLLILVLGIAFLIGMTWIGTVLTNVVPRTPSAQVQTVAAGPFQVTLQVDPNPPLITSPAALSVQVLQSSTLQPATGAQVTVETSMETMDMGVEHGTLQAGSDGMYHAFVHFSMSGPWQVQIAIAKPGAALVHATFEVTAQ